MGTNIYIFIYHPTFLGAIFIYFVFYYSLPPFFIYVIYLFYIFIYFKPHIIRFSKCDSGFLTIPDHQPEQHTFVHLATGEF